MIFLHRNSACFLSLVIYSILFCPTNVKAGACEDAVAASNRYVGEMNDRLDKLLERAKKNSMKSDEFDCELARANLDNWIGARPYDQRIEQTCGNRAQTKCDSTCAEKRIYGARADIAKSCGSGTIKKPVQNSHCTTPPSPGEFRRSPTRSCFIAVNTNSDERCVYSFTYSVIGTGTYHVREFGNLPGGNVAPGKFEERCTAREGVEIHFGQWTLSHSSAR